MFPFDIGLTLALVTSAASFFGWYRSNIRNGYANERQIAHVLRSLDQNLVALQEQYKQLDEVSDRLSRLEIVLLNGRGGGHHG